MSEVILFPPAFDPSGEELEIEAIEVPRTRLRRLQPGIVADLAQSMSRIGQLSPIVVGQDGLIAGVHRLEAAKQLGWRTIRSVITEDRSAGFLRLIEIDENLMRADLSPAERAAHQAERKEIYEVEYPGTRHVSERGGPGRGNKTTAKKTAVSYTSSEASRKTGVSERVVRREVARGKSIPDIVSIAGTSLDVAGELDALAKLPKAQQAEVMARARKGERSAPRRR
jgi:ParB family chromosome partitioning protein